MSLLLFVLSYCFLLFLLFLLLLLDFLLHSELFLLLVFFPFDSHDDLNLDVLIRNPFFLKNIGAYRFVCIGLGRLPKFLSGAVHFYLFFIKVRQRLLGRVSNNSVVSANLLNGGRPYVQELVFPDRRRVCFIALLVLESIKFCLEKRIDLFIAWPLRLKLSN